MNPLLKSLLSNGTAFGQGFAFATSPFSEFIVTEYYDGEVEGFARARGAEAILYFRKIWWDEGQANRLFEAFLIRDTELGEQSAQFLAFLEMYGSGSCGYGPFLEVDLGTAESLARFLMQAASNARLHIFSRDITKEIFVLPAFED